MNLTHREVVLLLLHSIDESKGSESALEILADLQADDPGHADGCLEDVRKLFLSCLAELDVLKGTLTGEQKALLLLSNNPVLRELAK